MSEDLKHDKIWILGQWFHYYMSNFHGMVQYI